MKSSNREGKDCVVLDAGYHPSRLAGMQNPTHTLTHTLCSLSMFLILFSQADIFRFIHVSDCGELSCFCLNKPTCFQRHCIVTKYVLFSDADAFLNTNLKKGNSTGKTSNDFCFSIWAEMRLE